MTVKQHQYDGAILKRLKFQYMILRMSQLFTFVGLSSIAWIVFLLLVEAHGKYAGVEWRYARFVLAVSIPMLFLGMVGRVFVGRRVDRLLPILIEGCCADCGYPPGRPLFEGACPECGASLLDSKQRRRWLAIFKQRNVSAEIRQPAS